MTTKNPLNITLPANPTSTILYDAIKTMLEHTESPLAALFSLGLPVSTVLRTFTESQKTGSYMSAIENFTKDNNLDFTFNSITQHWTVSSKPVPKFKVVVEDRSNTTFVFRGAFGPAAVREDIRSLLQYYIVACGMVRPGYDFGTVTFAQNNNELSVAFGDEFDNHNLAIGLEEFLTRAVVDKGSPTRKRTHDQLFKISQTTVNFLNNIKEVAVRNY